MSELQTKADRLISIIERYGYPKEFGIILVNELKTEKQIDRMIGYLLQAKPSSLEEIADELVAIKEEFHSYQQKKIAEYNNQKYNELLWKGLDDES